MLVFSRMLRRRQLVVRSISITRAINGRRCRSALLPLILLCVLGSLAPASEATATTQSIRKWVTCNGTSDDSAGTALAFAAARNNAFTLIVDCPVFIHSGLDPSRAIYIDNGTTVQFSGAGKFTVDNVLHPAFVIANTYNVTLTNWNVEYDASIPVNWNTGGYENNGVWISEGGYAQPAFAFENELTGWLSAHRSITFDRSVNHAVSAVWPGATNSCAVFFITGATSHVQVAGLRLYVPSTAGGNRFIPMAFSMTANYINTQTVNATTAENSSTLKIPSNLTFSNIYLDGTYMGWQGSAQSVLFEHIHSHRYGDLQDANGNYVGGVNKWFAPPHLFYLNYDAAGDAAFVNSNIHIENVVDDGIRVGVARDRGGSDSVSGYAASLKLGCHECSVNQYSSARPDGVLDILTSDNMTVSNVTASYDSSFLHNLYPGWRFPQVTTGNLTFENVALKDTAADSILTPLGSVGAESNQVITMTNIQLEVQKWGGKANTPITYFGGMNNNLGLRYFIDDKVEILAHTISGALWNNFEAQPNKLKSGGAVVLTWSAPEAYTCSASGAWSGQLIAAWGTRTIKLTSPGTYAYTIGCKSSKNTLSTTVHVVVTP